MPRSPHLADERLPRSRKIVDLAAWRRWWASWWRGAAGASGASRRIRRVGSVAATSVVLIDGAARTAADSTLARYIAATPRPLDPLTSIALWPESALDVDFARDRAAWSELAGFVETLGVPLVTGGIGTVLDDDGGARAFQFRPLRASASRHAELLQALARPAR